ncbi:Uncharacterized protein BM_BM17351 [Brugia malayi]|uniref:Uncharacterized protein n=1 Tax=Brugia malayi TaxID=6279 RepID=A0A4E9F2P4_BRUMA|nr:Uncharacterized protein BM_BM17351 [Brugia malayi]VIO90519.1 Uncharacterized protein BM_BM17351 [Brugia malayi]
MLSLTCMIMFCIILNIYAQKHSSSEQLHDDSQPRMFVNSKSESVRNNALVVSAQPPTIFQVPMLAAFNPFQLKHQNLEAKG